MKKIFFNTWPFLFLFMITLLFFSPIFKGKMPFPGDTLIGAYHPWRALSWEGRTTDYPLKNMTLADATNALYPWRFLAIKQMKEGQWPLWNNYEFSGTPLLAFPYTAAFYPLNFFFFLLSFNQAWTLLIVLQPILAGIFFYLFLLNKKLSKIASFLGAICFTFGSYFLLTTEFSVFGHTSLWFPLALLAVDKLFEKPQVKWFFVLVFSLAMAVLAGLVQFIVNGYILLAAYTLFHFCFRKRSAKKTVLLIFSGMVISLALTLIQTLPFLELLSISGRIQAYGDVRVMTRFFIPLPQFLMFLIPDFFGNPATANYWGKGSYFEFCGYTGIVSLLFVFYLLFSRRIKREGYFWLLVLLLSLFLAFKNPISSLPYDFKIPFLSSFIPARLLFFTTFALSVLTALGFEDFSKNILANKKGKTFWPLKRSFCLLIAVPLILFIDVFLLKVLGKDLRQESVILRNLVLPTLYLLVAGGILLQLHQAAFRRNRRSSDAVGVAMRRIAAFRRSRTSRRTSGPPVSMLGEASFFLYKFSRKPARFFLFLILLIIVFDLFRQGRKFLTFFDENLVYPEIGTTKFLKQNLGYSRFLVLHQEIFGTNHQTVYGLESIEGFSGCYNDAYGVFVSSGQASASAEPLSTHFERTVYGRNYSANIFNLLSVKYFLGFEKIDSPDYPLVYEEGRTKVYENKNVLPRVFLSNLWEKEDSPRVILNKIILGEDSPNKLYLEKEVNVPFRKNETVGEAKITDYRSGKISIQTDAPGSRILFSSDIYFPGWKVFIDGQKKEILKVNYIFRGVVLPSGKHRVDFIYDPQSFKIGLVISIITFILLAVSFCYEIIKSRYSSPKCPP